MADDQIREAVCSNVARLLREKRQVKGISMVRLAAAAGLSHAMISFIERELRNPTLDTLLRICSVLEVDLGDLINEAARAASRKSRM